MIVHKMAGLFPLSKINVCYVDYFMNANGDVYSTKRDDRPQFLRGQTTQSGRYYTFTLKGGGTRSVNHADLVRHVVKHPDFHRETAAVQCPPVVPETAIAWPTPTGEPVSNTDRDYATNLQDGIKRRGYIIGRVEGEALVFGSKPKVHTTLKSVKSEIERLANKTPGLQLVYFKIEGAARAAALVWE